MYTVGQRVKSVLWGKPVTGTVTRDNGAGITFVLWDGDAAPRWMHTESLTLID